MAAFDFPSSPILDQIHIENGIIWKYDGVRWLNTSAVGVTVYQATAIAANLAIVNAIALS